MVAALTALGWDDAWQAARDVAGLDLPAVRITAAHRGAFHATGADGTAWAELTGRAFHSARDKRQLPTVGDWVLVERWTEALAGSGAAVIREVLPRRSLLVRKAAGTATMPQPLAANVDLGVVMTSANTDLSQARLDRYACLLRDAGITIVIVLSKIDLAADREVALAAVPGALPLSLVTGEGLPAVRALGGPGKTCVLLGSSGVGKSTLMNALVGAATQLTQPIRDDDRGRHTTTSRQLFVTEHGLWIDTPGMRELAQWLDEDDAAGLAELAELATHCRFSDCRHRDEPGCAVRDVIDPRRLASYHKLEDERASGAHKQEAARRIAETRRAKARRYAPRPGKPEDES